MGERQSPAVEETIAIARAQEELRQGRETFDQRKAQDRRWFAMRLAMGWVALVVLPAIGALAAWMLFNHDSFPAVTVTLATSVLLVDIVGLVIAVWRVVLGSGPQALEPVLTPRTGGDSAKKRV